MLDFTKIDNTAIIDPKTYELTETGELVSAVNGVLVRSHMQGDTSLQPAYEILSCAYEAGADMDKFAELFHGIFG